MRRRPDPYARLMLAVPLMVVLAGCGLAGDNTGPADPTTTGTTPMTRPDSAPTAVAGPASTAVDPEAWCRGLEARTGGTVANPQLSELSGLAASQEHPGTLWAHNDSGHQAALFALATDGGDRGMFPLPEVTGVDIEDMALASGTVYLADIGDNDRARTEVALYRFAEPDPAAAGPVTEVEVLRFRYPDSAHDAEAFLVDPQSGQVAIVDKEIQLASADADTLLAPAPATVWVASPPFDPGQVTELEAAGTVALDELSRRTTAQPAPGTPSDLGLGGLATGADISADGRVIAVRTYTTLWLFPRPDGATMAEALAGTPCEAPTRPETQGEAVAFLAGPSVALATASEGLNPDLNLVTAG